MLKRITIILLTFIAGALGSLIMAYVQQDVWSNLFTLERLIATAVSILLMLLFVAFLETERALSWNWRWHRFWYLRELLQNPELRHWESDFARLEIVQGKRARISSAEVLAEGNRKDMIEALRELIKDRDEKKSRALVLGEPGSGKTTGLERLTLDLARAAKRRLGIGCKMPVLVRFGNFQDGRLIGHIAQTIRHGTKRSSGKILSKGIEMLLEHGQVVLLCDALDEALGTRRDLVIAELKNLLTSQAYQNVPIIITSRTREDPGEALKGLTAFEIQDLNDEAVNAFVHAYKRSEHNEAEITQRLHAHRLLEAGGLGRNPFWLRLIVASGAFEGNKGQILNTAVDTLLAREWDEKPRVERSWQRVLPRNEQLEETKRGLAFLGYWMSVGNMVAIEQEGVLIAYEKGWFALRQQVGVKGLRPQDVLGLGRDAQILVYEPGFVKFRHRLLQEFMAAWMLMFDKGLREQEIDRLIEQVEWWETLFLLGGLLGTDRLSEAHGQFVRYMLGDGKNDKRIFAGVGALYSVVAPPAELEDQVISAFMTSVLAIEDVSRAQIIGAQKLGSILGDEAAEIFARLFYDSTFKTKRKGAALLCSLKTPRADQILLSAVQDPQEHDVTVDILLSLGILAADQLRAGLRKVHLFLVELEKQSATSFQGLGQKTVKNEPRALPYLITTLRFGDLEAKCFAARMIAHFADRSVIGPLIEALDDPEALVRWYAAETLNEIAELCDVDLFLPLLQKRDLYVCRQAIESLGKIGDPRAVEPLIRLLYHPEQDIRLSTVHALEKIADSRAFGPLINTLHDISIKVRNGATDALMKIGISEISKLGSTMYEQDPDVRQRGANIIFALGENAAYLLTVPILKYCNISS